MVKKYFNRERAITSILYNNDTQKFLRFCEDMRMLVTLLVTEFEMALSQTNTTSVHIYI